MAAEAGLVAKAVNGMDARRLRQAARRMLDGGGGGAEEINRSASPTSTRPVS